MQKDKLPERFPEISKDDEELEEEEGIATLFGKLIASKLRGGKKKFAEVSD